MTYAKTKIAIIAAAAAAILIGVQMNSISELKMEVSAYEQRETEFVARSERLEELEEKIKSLPAEVRSQITGLDNQGRAQPVAGTRRAKPGHLDTWNERQLKSSATLSKLGRTGASETAEAAEEEDVPASANAFGKLADMMKDPVMRKMIEKQMEVQLEATFGAFFDYLDLDDEKRAELKGALHQRQLAMADIGMGELVGSDGEIDLEGASDITAIADEHTEKLRSLMGDEKFAEFERFEQSTSEREELSTFRQSLEESGKQLTFETEQKLMAIMFEENGSIDHPSAMDSLPAEALKAGIVSPEQGEALIIDERATQERIQKRVAAILTPEELD
ncbi:MAG: hypothetical protein ACI9R3_006146 [Verrucomicrobiales bacterium]|jgi:hypothetical protein